MKKIILFLLFLFYITIIRIEAQCKIDYSNYYVVLEENFDSKTTVNDIDTDIWAFRPEDPGMGWGDENDGTKYYGRTTFGEYYDKSQLSIISDPTNPSNHFLRIIADKIDPNLPDTVYCGTCCFPCSTCPPTFHIIGGNRYPKYKTGMIKTKQSVYPGLHGIPFDGDSSYPSSGPAVWWGGFKYGIFEIRMRVPSADESFPAFWTTGPAPLSIYEGKDYRNIYGVGYGDGWDTSIKSNGIWMVKAGVDSLSDKFHTYTGVWTPDTISFFLDGREICTYSGNNISNYNAFTSCANMMIADLQMRSYYTVQRAIMDIDYIKVYKPVTASSWYPFKSKHEFMNHDVFADKSLVPQKVSEQYQTIAPSITGDTVYYQGTDDSLYEAIKNTSGDWSVNTIEFNYAATTDELHKYNLVYDDASGHIFYTGYDDKLKMWGWDNTYGYWYQVVIDNSSNPDYLVYGPSAMTVKDGEVYYIGANGHIQKWYWSGGSMVHDNIPYTYASIDELGFGDINVEKDGSEYHIAYKGADNRLQMLGPNSPPSTTYWHWYITPSTDLVSSTPGSFTIGDPGEYFFVGTDNKIHRYYWTTSGFLEDHDIISYVYGTVGYTNGDYVRSNITYDRVNKRILYFGYDGRLQYFCWDPVASSWYHAYLDDYWNTNEFASFNNTVISSYHTSVIWNEYSGAIFYNGDCEFSDFNQSVGHWWLQDEHQFLRYFNWDYCGVDNPVNQSWRILARTINAKDTLGVPLNHYNIQHDIILNQLSSSGNTGDIVIYPNPSKTGKFYVTNSIRETTSFEVTNVAGKIILNTTEALTTIDLSNEPNGVYFVKVKTNNDVFRQKLIINK